jgi:putative transposase
MWFASRASAAATILCRTRAAGDHGSHQLVTGEEDAMFVKLWNRARQLLTAGVQGLQERLRSWTAPPSTSHTLAGLRDLTRSKRQLVLENALLRQQLLVLNRSAKRPRLTRADRVRIVLLASRLPHWKVALLIVKPETVLRWHRQGFRLFWKRKSRTTAHEPKIPAETITLIKAMAADNRLWGADRIQGELLKLHITVAKRTIQRYMHQARPPRPRGQTWTTFLLCRLLSPRRVPELTLRLSA